MKKLSILLFALIAFTGLNSCSSDDDIVFIAQPDPEGISFTNSFNESYILTPATGTNVAERFVWNTVDFSAPTNITYELQGSVDPDFESHDEIGRTTSNNFAVTVNQMRALAADAGLDNDPATDEPNTGQIYFRVQAYAGTGGGTNLVETSEVVSVTVVLPEGEGEEVEELPLNLFLVGSATATGWDNSPTSNNYPLFRDADNENLYHYTGKFAGGADVAFKLIEVKGLWAPQYGGQSGTLVYRPTEAEPDPAAIAVSEEGYYTLTVNIDELTYTLTPFDASSTPTIPTIGIIGSATTGSEDTGWSDDIDMTQSTFDPHIWFIRGMELFEVEGADGKIKFRSNNSWDVNWGGPSSLSGQATQNGADIVVPAGIYDIWFNDITKRYILIPVE